MEKMIEGYEEEIRLLKSQGNQFEKLAREKLEG
jgi:hypothetical protein